MVIVAQLVRALDCGSRGRGFESPLSPGNKRSFILFFWRFKFLFIFATPLTGDTKSSLTNWKNKYNKEYKSRTLISEGMKKRNRTSKHYNKFTMKSLILAQDER